MTPSERGNPTLKVRLDPELVAKTQLAFPTVKGRSGGVALALRRLLYLALDEPMPKQYGEIGRSLDVDTLEADVRALEGQTTQEPSSLKEASQRARELLRETEDPVDRIRLLSALGRLQIASGRLAD